MLYINKSPPCGNVTAEPQADFNLTIYGDMDAIQHARDTHKHTQTHLSMLTLIRSHTHDRAGWLACDGYTLQN